MARHAYSEQIVDASGCGPFQVMVVSLFYLLTKHPIVSVSLFMSFGAYDPGSRCLDGNHSIAYTNYSTTHTNSEMATINPSALTLNNKTNANVNYVTIGHNFTTSKKDSRAYRIESCEVFESCQNNEFDPRTLTVVSDFGLVCSQKNIPGLILSIQMLGWTAGALVSGQLGDTYGRKKVFYICLTLTGIFNLASAFSPNWQVLAAFRFLIGFVVSPVLNLSYVLPSEVLNHVWRGRVPSLPAEHTGGIVFALIALACKDWRVLSIITAGMCFVSCLPALCVPESIRWLEVNEKRKEFEKVAQKIRKMNGISNDAEEFTNLSQKLEDSSNSDNQQEHSKVLRTKRYTYVDIFRHGYLEKSVILGFLIFSIGLIYCAIVFGMKAMPGSIYINILILSSTEVLFSVITVFAPGIIGRKKCAALFFSLSTVALLGTAALEHWGSGSLKETGTLVLAILGKTLINAAWFVLIILTTEIYPTVVRSIGTTYIDIAARIGFVVGPIVMPNTSEDIFLCYLVMGCLALGCSLLVLRMPETKGKPLKETFDKCYEMDEID